MEQYVETEEMIYLPEEKETKVEGNLTIYTHKFYKQMKYVDKNLKETFGERIIDNSYITSKEEIEVEPNIVDQGNIKIINYMKKNKFTDKDGNVTYDEPIIYKTDTREIQTHYETHYETRYVYVDREDEEKKKEEEKVIELPKVEIKEEKGFFSKALDNILNFFH